MPPVASSLVVSPGQPPSPAPAGKIRLYWDVAAQALKAIDDSGVVLAETFDIPWCPTNAPPAAPPDQYIRLFFDTDEGLVKYQTSSGSSERIDRSEWFRPRFVQLGPQANYNLNPSGVIMPAWNVLGLWGNSFSGVSQLFYVDPADNTRLRVHAPWGLMYAKVAGSLSIRNDESNNRMSYRASLWVNGSEMMNTRVYVNCERSNQAHFGSIVFPGFPVPLHTGDYLQVKIFGATNTTFNSTVSTSLLASESSLTLTALSGVYF